MAVMRRSALVALAVVCLGIVSCAAPSGESLGPAAPADGAAAPVTSAAANTPAEVGAGRASCQATPPPQPPFVPPEPYPATPSPFGRDKVWYGSDELWTTLDTDGSWELVPDEHGLFDKSFWWRAGFDALHEPTPRLTLTTTRVDVPGPEIAASSGDATHGWIENHDSGAFMLTGIRLPTAGCWKITGHYGTSELSYVVWVP
jgi:hypothetical protein